MTLHAQPLGPGRRMAEAVVPDRAQSPRQHMTEIPPHKLHTRDRADLPAVIRRPARSPAFRLPPRRAPPRATGRMNPAQRTGGTSVLAQSVGIVLTRRLRQDARSCPQRQRRNALGSARASRAVWGALAPNPRHVESPTPQPSKPRLRPPVAVRSLARCTEPLRSLRRTIRQSSGSRLPEPDAGCTFTNVCALRYE